MNNRNFPLKYAALVPLAALLTTSCTSKSLHEGKQPLALAISAPSLPAELQLAESMVLQPFQFSLRIEGATGVIYEDQVQVGQELSLMVPAGELKFSASFLGFYAPAGMPTIEMCKTESQSTNTSLADGTSGDTSGGGPETMLYSSVTFNATPNASAVVEIKFPQAAVASMKRFGMQLEGLSTTALADAKIEFTDPATGVLFKGPCDASIGDSFETSGKLAEKFPYIHEGAMSFKVTAGGSTKSFKTTLSNTTPLSNFFTINFGTATVGIMPGTADFDGDGVNNQTEIAQNRNPFEAFSASSFYVGVGPEIGGKFAAHIYSHSSYVPTLACKVNDSSISQPCSSYITFCNIGTSGCETLAAGTHTVKISGVDSEGFAIPETALSFTYSGSGSGTCTTTDCGTSEPFILLSNNTYPASNAGGIDPRANIVLSFNRSVNISSLAGKIKIVKTSDKSELTCAATYESEKGIICKPSAILQNNSDYRVIVYSGILASDGTALTIGDDWDFVTTSASSAPLAAEYIWPNNVPGVRDGA
jgi:hypothetical protein